jgi:alpha-L-fucosidase
MGENISNRRDFLKKTAFSTLSLTAVASVLSDIITGAQSLPPGKKKGAQRLSLEKLHAWEKLEFGMFIHFGMSTFDGDELSKGDKPSTVYAPDKLDVDQWIQTARDAGMTYAVLTAKHVAGHCLWPTQYNNYHVGNSGNTTDVLGAFVTACEKYSILPGFYYCSWDNHNLFGSATPTFAGVNAFTTAEYRDFQMKQIEEIIKTYGPFGEIWIDIPKVLGHDGRRKQYSQISRLLPDAVIMMNHGITNGSKLNYHNVWPTDLMSIERYLPSSKRGYNPWFQVPLSKTQKDEFYIPGEVCDPIGYEWFYKDQDHPRSDAELLGMRLICRERGVNLLLNVPPDRHGVIPKRFTASLMRLRKNTELFEV